MGAVFKAIQLSMNRLVALKILPMTLAKDKTYIRRFLREAKSAAQMNHSNLTKVYDVGSYRGVFYFSMEYVDGATLLDLIKSEGKLDPELDLLYPVYHNPPELNHVLHDFEALCHKAGVFSQLGMTRGSQI